MTRKGSDLAKRKKDRHAISGELRKVVKRKKQDENKEAREGVAVVVTNADLVQGSQRSVASREDTRTVPTKKTKAAVDKPGSTTGGGKGSGFLMGAPKTSRASKEKKPNVLAGMSEGEKDTVRAGWDKHRTEADARGGGSRSEETTAGIPNMTANGPIGTLAKDVETGLPVNRDHLNSDSATSYPDRPAVAPKAMETVTTTVPRSSRDKYVPYDQATQVAEGPAERYGARPRAPIMVHEHTLSPVEEKTKPRATTQGAQEHDYAVQAATAKRALRTPQTVSGTHFLCPECHLITPTESVSRTPGRMGARCTDCAGE
jgi:hypothetical protein